jgi:photosystem II stability/assembly factor-like uncharacterized protein
MRLVIRSFVLAVVLGLLFTACSPVNSTIKSRVTEPPSTSPVSPANTCSTPARLGGGASVPPARLGAIDFLSAKTAVALSAKAIPCEVALGEGKGYEVIQQTQPVRLAVTTDGGNHWITEGSAFASRVTSTGPIAEQVVAASTSVAWALDDEGTLLETTDSGATWAPQSVPTPVERMARVGDSVWIVACPSLAGAVSCASPVVEYTPLTGGAWQRLTAPPIGSAVAPTLNVVSGQEVVLAFSADSPSATALAVTTDGGQKWTVPTVPRGPENLCQSYPDFAADSPNDWWLLCVGGAAAGSSTKALMRSTDGGQTWATVSSVSSLTTPSPPGSLSLAEPAALAAASPSQLWLAGFNGMTESSDGGVTWTGVPGINPEGSSTGSFDVLSPNAAWLLAPGTGLWTTSNGTTWHALGAVVPY